jgi:hypothetical protein
MAAILAAQIRHTIDLALRLIDTTIGTTITDDIRLWYNGKPYLANRSPDGEIIFMGTHRQDFTLTITARGYEQKIIEVQYSQLDQSLPYIQTHLIPDEKYLPHIRCHTLKGTLKNIIEIDAVKITQHHCYIKEFDERKKLITLFNLYNLTFNRIYYAAISPDNTAYEPFTIAEQIDSNTCQIEKSFEQPCEQLSIAPRVIGKVHKGQYLLRVRDDSDKADWLIRCTTNKGEFFKIVDFKQKEEVSL